MAYTWSKEDRHHYGKSEVMQELEKRVLDTVSRAEILQRKIAASSAADVNAYGDAVNKATEALKGLTQAQRENANAALDEASDETAEDGLDLAEDLQMQNEVVDDLQSLVMAALAEGNIKLAYRIERTIDEILEQDVRCG